MIVETSGLRKEYGPVRALAGVDLEIAAGGVVGILGPNGAGKTTLVEILEGLRRPTAGRVVVLGLDPARYPRELRERIGLQLQSVALPPELTPAETVRLFAALYPRALSPAEVLERVALTAEADRRNRTLSGGQQRRLAIGLALVNEPELLLLDEPTSGLDPIARRGLRSLLAELRTAGRTVILTTHSTEEAEVLCDRVVILRGGRVVADGSPFDLVGRARGASRLWLAVEGDLDTEPLLRSGATLEGRDGDHLRFATHAPTAAVLALGEALAGGRATLTDLRLSRPGLDQVYLDLMGEGGGEASAGAGEEER